MNNDQEIEIVKLLLVCAMIRMRDCSHLDVGNYVATNLRIVKAAVREI